MKQEEPHLVSISDSDFSCSLCSDWTIVIKRMYSQKTDAEWRQFVEREFSDHVRCRHGPNPTGETLGDPPSHAIG